MTMASGSDSWRRAAAHQLLVQLHQRTALNEGVGILQSWNTCAQQDARDHLLVEHGRGGQDAEADRMIALVDAAADRRTDPDARWE